MCHLLLICKIINPNSKLKLLSNFSFEMLNAFNCKCFYELYHIQVNSIQTDWRQLPN